MSNSHSAGEGGRSLGNRLKGLVGRAPVMWETHAVGERMLLDELSPLRHEGYEIFADRHLEPGGREVVDAIVIGPPGVFLFDAKHWWGKVAIEQSSLIQERRYRRDRTGDIDKLLSAAKHLGQVTATYVHPFLILTGEAQLGGGGGGSISKVRVRDVTGTAAYLRAQIQTLSADDVRRLGALVDQNFPPRDHPPAGAGAGATVVPVPPGGLPYTGPRPSDDPDATGPVPTFYGGAPPTPYQSSLRPGTDAGYVDAGSPWAGRQGSGSGRGFLRIGRPAILDRFAKWGALLSVGAVLLAFLLFSGFLTLIAAWAPLGGAVACPILSDEEASTAARQELDGRRRLLGGCSFAPADGGESVLLVWRDQAAMSRSKDSDGLLVVREDCGVLAVAPTGARLPGIRETAARRETAVAVCVRLTADDTSGDRAEATAVRAIASAREAQERSDRED